MYTVVFNRLYLSTYSYLGWCVLAYIALLLTKIFWQTNICCISMCVEFLFEDNLLNLYFKWSGWKTYRYKISYKTICKKSSIWVFIILKTSYLYMGLCFSWLTVPFLKLNNKFSEYWNPVNILSCDAATVGNFDLGLINKENNLLKNLKSNKFDIV